MEIAVTAVPAGGKKIDTAFDGFCVRTDLTEGAGGEGAAPEPLDMLFVAVASCAANYAVEFCQARSLSTDGMQVRLVARRTEEGGLFDDMTLQVELPRDFPEKYRKAIVRAMEKCTVKKHLQAPIDVRAEVVG